MSRIPVQFTYMTGIAENLFSAARLTGSWDANGRRTAAWSSVDMAPTPGRDGCSAFEATVHLEAEDGEFEWGVELLTSRGEWRWGIVTEVRRADSDRRVRIVRPSPQAAPGEIQQEIYCFNHSRHVGAQKYFRHPNDPNEPAAIRFSCWAPNARAVEVRLANLWQAGQDPVTASLIDPTPTPNGRALRSFDRHAICGGYIADSGDGEHRSWARSP